MRKLITIAATLLLIGGGCLTAQEPLSTSTPKAPAVAEESSFEKKKECALLRKDAQTQLEENYQFATPYFYDIFYSPKLNSCVYTYGVLLFGESPNELGSFILADFFTGETIVSENYDNSSDDESRWSYEVRPIWSQQVDEYR